MSRTSSAPLVDPLFASLVSGAGAGPAAGASAVGPGGVARGAALEGLEGGVPRWRAGTERLPGRGRGGAAHGEGEGEGEGDSERGRGLSVAALELERDAWAGLVRALEAGR